MPSAHPAVAVSRPQFDKVLATLRADGFTLIGPSPHRGRITLTEIESVRDLPDGWRDDRAPGRYRLEKDDHESRWFGHTVPPDSWKRILNPPSQVLFSSAEREGRWTIEPEPVVSRKLAFIGIRPCDLAAIEILDRVLGGGNHPDHHYRARRADLFILVAQCDSPAESCFCESLRTGPVAASGFDLAVWETGETIVVEIGTERGAKALEDVEARPASPRELERTRQLADRSRRRITRKVDLEGIGEVLFHNLEHPRWGETAMRCLGCGNCTMVCPTCFCNTVDDEIDAIGTATRRVRLWDSCFTTAFSHVHGGNIRPSLSARYRQRITHKFASWQFQFGQPGCVGCGRCITFCPAGIDPVEDLAEIRKGATR
ncbi:MAG: 4Fe-4S dicluster domain-containing protein [Thermoanaerobaculia bacterium]